jgi:hypothetical protein
MPDIFLQNPASQHGEVTTEVRCDFEPGLFYILGDPPPPPEAIVRNPANLHDRWGGFHRVNTEVVEEGPPEETRIRYRRSDAGPRPFMVSILATPGPADSYPRLFIDNRERVFIIYQEGPDLEANIMEVYSDSDGEDWSDPAMAIAGGTRPTAAVATSDSSILRAAHVAGTVTFTRQHVGDAVPSAPYQALDDTGAVIEIGEDTIGLCEAHETACGWTMSIIVAGETAVSDWRSWDDGETWERIV